MPTYNYECSTHGEFEIEHSIKIKLEFCPKCKEEGVEHPVKRLISLNGKGVVELSIDELKIKLKNDSKQLQKDAAKDERIYSSLIGENRYQSIQQGIDKRKRGW